MEEKLEVIYNDKNGINSELDNALRQLLKTLGYEFIGSGTMLESGKRDLSFKKKGQEGKSNLAVVVERLEVATKENKELKETIENIKKYLLVK